MNTMQLQMNFFEDNSPDGLLRQEFILLHASTEKVRRGCFAKISSQQKQLELLKDEIENLKKLLGIKNEEFDSNDSDLPILQFA